MIDIVHDPTPKMQLVTEACLRPDGKLCAHPRDHHGYDHPYQGQYCIDCMTEDGAGFGPFIHDWNPAVLTEGGWLALYEQPERVFRWQFEKAAKK